jgi:histidinol phosphatase-like enzyme (inositol monophosphatase family)
MTPPSPPLAAEIRRRLELALDAGRQAGRRTLDFFQQACCAVERKADDSPVTAADRTAEQLLRERIAQAFPADGIVGEEFGATPGHSDFTWILDPIDGTKSFIHGVPLYGTMIGIACQERALAGFVYFPALDEAIHAAVGEGAWHVRGQQPPRRARVSTKTRLADGLLVTSQIDSFARRGAAAAFQALEAAAWVTRTWGDCYGYLLVATGRAEVMIDPILNVWDAAAVQPIIEEAGGSFTDWAGRSTIQAGEAVATNGAVLAEVLQITAPFAAQGQFPGPAPQSG